MTRFVYGAALMVLASALGSGCASRSHWEIDPRIRDMVRAVNADRIEDDVRTLVNFGTRNTMSETESETRGIGAARRWIKREFETISADHGGRLQVAFDGYLQEPDGNRIVKPVEIVNVVATLPGTDPTDDRVYIVSGHYDSICSDSTDYMCDAPGAGDDASGVAAVLEAARVMTGAEYEATIVFMAVAGEEQGLFGSKYMAKKARESGVNVAGMLTNDIIGNSLSDRGERVRDRVRVFSHGVPLHETEEQATLRFKVGNENDSSSRQLARYIDEACGTYVRGFDVTLIFRIDRFLRGGDHKPYVLEGFPGVRFTEYHEDYRHQHQNVRVEDGDQFGDLPEFVDFDYVADVTRVNVASLASLARAPARPENVRIITAKLTTDTTLRWDAGRAADLVRYEVMWRETTSPVWQWRKQTRMTEITLPLSKDNYSFAVATVDAAGHRSPGVYPIPSRE